MKQPPGRRASIRMDTLLNLWSTPGEGRHIANEDIGRYTGQQSPSTPLMRTVQSLAVPQD